MQFLFGGGTLKAEIVAGIKSRVDFGLNSRLYARDLWDATFNSRDVFKN